MTGPPGYDTCTGTILRGPEVAPEDRALSDKSLVGLTDAVDTLDDWLSCCEREIGTARTMALPDVARIAKLIATRSNTESARFHAFDPGPLLNELRRLIDRMAGYDGPTVTVKGFDDLLEELAELKRETGERWRDSDGLRKRTVDALEGLEE